MLLMLRNAEASFVRLFLLKMTYKDCRLISVLILRESKRINLLLFLLTSLENLWWKHHKTSWFKVRNQLIWLNSFNVRTEIWRQSIVIILIMSFDNKRCCDKLGVLKFAEKAKGFSLKVQNVDDNHEKAVQVIPEMSHEGT